MTGLAGEAACLEAAAGCRAVRCYGPGPEAASRAARDLLAAGCSALLSFGIAGGLQQPLPAGHLVIAEAVVTPQGHQLPTDARWSARLTKLLTRDRRVERGTIAGSDRPLCSVAEKRALNRATGAVAVDMESHAVAHAAARAGVPFVAVRAICDPATTALPGWLAVAVDDTGRPRLKLIAARLAARPVDLPRLLALARQQRLALASLRRAGRDAGPLFGYV